jgi:hypothetical protein
LGDFSASAIEEVRGATGRPRTGGGAARQRAAGKAGWTELYRPEEDGEAEADDGREEDVA